MKKIVELLIYDRVKRTHAGTYIQIADPEIADGLTPQSGDTFGWVGASGWTASGIGLATFEGSQQNQGYLSQVLAKQIRNDLDYQIQFQLSGITGGSINLYLGTEFVGSYSADGSYSFIFKQSGMTELNELSFRPSVDFSGSVKTDTIKISEKKELNKKADEVLYRPKGKLQTKEDITIAFSYEVSDLKELNDSQGGWTKSFVIPGTKHNRELLGMPEGKNVVMNNYDIRNRIKCDILVDLNTFRSGWLVVESIDDDGGEVNYNCKFYDSVFGLFNIIRPKFVSDIDMSDFDHKLTWNKVYDTWDTGRTWNSVYTYPLTYLPDREYYTMRDFTPSFYNRYLFDRIIYDAGYSYDISPMFGNVIDRSILYPEGKRKSIGDVKDSDGIYVGTANNELLYSTGTVVFSSFVVRSNRKNVAFEDNYTDPFYDHNANYNNTLYEYNLTQAGVDHTFEFVLNTTVLSKAKTDAYDDDINSLEITYLCTAQDFDPYYSSDPNVGFSSDAGVSAWVEDPFGVPVFEPVFFPFVGNFHQIQENENLHATTGTTEIDFVFSGSAKVDNAFGGKYKLKIQVYDNLYWVLKNNFTPGLEYRQSYERNVTISGNSSYFKVEPNLNSQVGDNAPIRLNKWLPKISQSEFISEWMDITNAFVFQDNNGSLRFITRPELYATDKVIDITGKVKDFVNIERLTNITSSKTLLGYKETEDTFNDNYRSITKSSQYGDFIYDNITDLYNEIKEDRSKIYGSTPIISDSSGRIVPAIVAQDSVKNNRLLLQGRESSYTERMQVKYYDPFGYGGSPFDDNFNYDAYGPFIDYQDLGFNYQDGYVGFTSFTQSPHNFQVGDLVRIFQDPFYDPNGTYDPSYNGDTKVLKIIDDYGWVSDKPWNGSTSVSPGRAYLYPIAYNYRQDTHLDIVTASTLDVNYGPVEYTFLDRTIPITQANLSNLFRIDQFNQLRDSSKWTVACDLSTLDVRDMMANVGAKIYIGGDINKYFNLQSIKDHDVTRNDLTVIELIEATQSPAFEFTGGTNPVPDWPSSLTNAGGVSQVGGAIFSNNGNGISLATSSDSTLSSPSSLSLGSGNRIYGGGSSVFVVGDNNSIAGGSRNVIVLGSGAKVNESNSMYFSNYGRITPTHTKFYDKVTMTRSGIIVDNVFIGNSGITVGTAPTGVTITSTGITIGDVTISSASTLPVATDGEMMYNSGGTWVRRDMGIRVADNASDWFRIGSSTNNIQTESTSTSAIVGGSSNTIFSGKNNNGIIIGGSIHSMHPASNQALVGGIASIISASTYGSIVGGRKNNLISSAAGNISGGFLLSAYTAEDSFLAGGRVNLVINSTRSSIVGGFGNTIDGGASNSLILGGINNRLTKTLSSAVIAASGIVGNEDYTLYTNNISTNAISATTFYSGNTNIADLLGVKQTYPYRMVNSNYTIDHETDSVIGVATSAGLITINLPSSLSTPQYQYIIKDISNSASYKRCIISAGTLGDVIIDGSGSGQTFTSLGVNGESLSLINNGQGSWLVV